MSELNKKNNIEILKKAISHYGEKAQIDICIEECSELIKALIKDRRYETTDTFNDIVEELTDVLICIDYIKLIYDIPDEAIQAMCDFKLDRINNRMVVDEIAESGEETDTNSVDE